MPFSEKEWDKSNYDITRPKTFAIEIPILQYWWQTRLYKFIDHSSLFGSVFITWISLSLEIHKYLSGMK